MPKIERVRIVSRKASTGPRARSGRTRARSLALGLLLVAAVPAAAQEVRGVVLADDDAVRVTAAVVTLLAADGAAAVRVETNEEGRFTLRVAAAGTYRLRAERLGYVSWTSDPIEIGSRDWVEVEVRLGVDAIPLEPLRVVASAPGMTRERPTVDPLGGGTRITREEIERSNAVRTSEVLRPVAGVILRPVVDGGRPSGDGRYLVQMREGSLSQCLAAVFVDGTYMPQSTAMTIDDYLDPEALEAVEVYAAAPLQYQRAGSCGAVLFWRRTAPQEAGGAFSWTRFAIGAGLLGLTWVIGR